jgi:hypothetical protein
MFMFLLISLFLDSFRLSKLVRIAEMFSRYVKLFVSSVLLSRFVLPLHPCITFSCVSYLSLLLSARFVAVALAVALAVAVVVAVVVVVSVSVSV